MRDAHKYDWLDRYCAPDKRDVSEFADRWIAVTFLIAAAFWGLLYLALRH